MHIFTDKTFIDLNMYQFGYQQCAPNHSFGPAARNHFLFHYIISGKGCLHSQDSHGNIHVYYLEHGQGFLIWPNQINHYFADGKDPWTYSWIEFDGLKAKQLVLQSGLDEDNPVYTPAYDTERQKMADALMYIIENPTAPPYELIGHLYIFVSAFINSSKSKKKTTKGGLRNFYCNEVVSHIKSHYREDITVNSIAQALNLDRSYLSKIFKNTMDISLQNFLIQYRINKACEYMINTNLTITEISQLVGYANIFNFSRSFSKVKGVSPGKWRAENQLR